MMGFWERLDRRNQAVLEAHNERAKTEPLVAPGALAVIFGEVTLWITWTLFLIATILVTTGETVAIIIGALGYLAAVSALVIGIHRTVEQIREARRHRRRPSARRSSRSAR